MLWAFLKPVISLYELYSKTKTVSARQGSRMYGGGYRMVVFFAAFLLSLIFVLITIRYCGRHNIYDEVNSRKVHDGNIPRLGGIGIFLSFAIVSAAYVVFFRRDNFVSFLPVLVAFTLIFVFALLDDLISLRALLKLLFQVIAALMVALSQMYFKNFLGFTIAPLLGRTMTFIWILLCVNAFNLIDGIDWLCSGISFLSLLTLGIVQLLLGGTTHPFYFILAGAVLGFMVWNKPPAKIFLGDCGSQMLGFAIAAFPLLDSSNPKFEYSKIIVLFLLASIPVTDVIAAIFRRTREHRFWFVPDKAHIHHKLLNIGFLKTTAVFFLLMIQTMISIVIIGSYFMSERSAVIVLLVANIFVEVIFIMFHYLNYEVNRKHQGHLQNYTQE